MKKIKRYLKGDGLPFYKLSRSSAWLRACVIIIILVFFFAANTRLVHAGTVYGRVHPPETARSITITFINRESGERYNVTTDNNGNYTIFLPEGSYDVEFDTLRARIKSYPAPTPQDIYLR